MWELFLFAERVHATCDSDPREEVQCKEEWIVRREPQMRDPLTRWPREWYPDEVQSEHE